VTRRQGCRSRTTIPSNRIDPNGQALNLFPAPNAVDPQRQYNYTFQSWMTIRERPGPCVDWNVANNTTFYSRLNLATRYKGGWGFVLNNANWPNCRLVLKSIATDVNAAPSFSPTLGAGDSRAQSRQTVAPLTQADLQNNDRTQVLRLPQLPGREPVAHHSQCSFGASGLAFGMWRPSRHSVSKAGIHSSGRTTSGTAGQPDKGQGRTTSGLFRTHDPSAARSATLTNFN
jgi:hypothetical protein